jgi:hypothetical protein
MFRLEALSAKHGDALLLTFGDADAPRYVLIDGGPSGVFKNSLHPRLDQLRSELADDEPAELGLVIVSHADDDHIRGILELMDLLEEIDKAQEPPPFRIGGLWHNAITVDELEPVSPKELAASVAASGETAAGVGPESAAVIASIPQAERLANIAVTLHIDRNAEFEHGRAVADAEPVDLGEDLSVRVIAPDEQRFEDLRKKWQDFVDARKKANDKKAIAKAAADVDTSVFNLSSIIVLASRKGRTMLLTGDARSDHMLSSLEAAGLMPNGTLHLDLLKVAHHGSARNVTQRFFEKVTADHYVISADGRHGNPDLPTLEMLTVARGGDRYVIHLTNSEPRLVAFFAADKAKGRNYDVDFRPIGASSVVVELDP